MEKKQQQQIKKLAHSATCIWRRLWQHVALTVCACMYACACG